MYYQQLFEEIQYDLNYVESELHKYTRSSVKLLTKSSKWLVEAGVKGCACFVLLSESYSNMIWSVSANWRQQLSLYTWLHWYMMMLSIMLQPSGVPTVSAEWGDSLDADRDYIFGQALKILARYGTPEDYQLLHQ